jgi:citronellyl-CoA dehydrogenase
MQRTQEHEELYRSLRRFIDREINPHVDAWEEAQAFPAHELFRKLGQSRFLGVSKPVEYGGMGLDCSYGLVATEALGHIDCGAIPMAIGVHTDMATPALASTRSAAAPTRSC